MKYRVEGLVTNPLRPKILEVEADSLDEARGKVAGEFVLVSTVTELPSEDAWKRVLRTMPLIFGVLGCLYGVLVSQASNFERAGRDPVVRVAARFDTSFAAVAGIAVFFLLSSFLHMLAGRLT